MLRTSLSTQGHQSFQQEDFDVVLRGNHLEPSKSTASRLPRNRDSLSVGSRIGFSMIVSAMPCFPVPIDKRASCHTNALGSTILIFQVGKAILSCLRPQRGT